MDTYEYRVHRAGTRPLENWAEGTSSQRPWLVPSPGELLRMGEGGVAVWAVADMLWLTPYAMYKLATHPRGQVKIAFGPDDRVAWIGSPSPYGPPDDALDLSTNEIRATCRSEALADPRDFSGAPGRPPMAPVDLYFECLVKRLPI